ncbi:MAG: Uma2 family endonuclease [Vulcanimicrobiaceae bacterium]
MQISVPEPYLVESEPASEWLLGAPVQKVSPRYTHALLQRLLATELGEWSRGRGRVGTEWRFWLTPPGEPARYFVPDIAYLSYARLAREAREEAQEPAMAPEVAVEIRSPDDRNLHVLHKIDVYLRSGTALVASVDPERRRIALHDRETELLLVPGDVFGHRALPGFSLEVARLFSALDE